MTIISENITVLPSTFVADIDDLFHDAITLLKQLISTPSFSKEEEKTADLLEAFFKVRKIECFRKNNNVWAYNKHFSDVKPTLLLCSHHDTVKPNSGWTNDPFLPLIKDGKLFGLGSNDAGGAVVSITAAFLYFYNKENLPYNIALAITAEEEISGKNGTEMILPELGEIDFAIAGEPTEMHMAIAEKGLLVVDCTAHGKSGHAARDEGENAIYKAIKDIEWFRNFKFPVESELLGPVKMNVTMINAGTQHNVIPDKCSFTVDIRVTDAYSHKEILEVLKTNVSSEITPRSVRLKPSSIPKEHLFIKTGIDLGRKTYGSSTTSDQALLNCPTLKMGPGDSARSHTADEFIYLQEIKEGIEIYIKLLQNFFAVIQIQNT